MLPHTSTELGNGQWNYFVVISGVGMAPFPKMPICASLYQSVPKFDMDHDDPSEIENGPKSPLQRCQHGSS